MVIAVLMLCVWSSTSKTSPLTALVLEAER